MLDTTTERATAPEIRVRKALLAIVGMPAPLREEAKRNITKKKKTEKITGNPVVINQCRRVTPREGPN